jgi:hypothetical protein
MRNMERMHKIYERGEGRQKGAWKGKGVQCRDRLLAWGVIVCSISHPPPTHTPSRKKIF